MQLQRSCCTAAQAVLAHAATSISICFRAAWHLQSQLPCKRLQCPVAHLHSPSPPPSMWWVVHHAAHLKTVFVHSAGQASPVQLIFPPSTLWSHNSQLRLADMHMHS